MATAPEMKASPSNRNVYPPIQLNCTLKILLRMYQTVYTKAILELYSLPYLVCDNPSGLFFFGISNQVIQRALARVCDNPEIN
jgi:hypothetical protein